MQPSNAAMRCGFVTAAGVRCRDNEGHRGAHLTDWIFDPSERPTRRMAIWKITTAWGVYAAPEHAVRVYSKKIRRRLFGYTVQVGESAHPALILWPHGDSIWLPFVAITRIELATISV